MEIFAAAAEDSVEGLVKSLINIISQKRIYLYLRIYIENLASLLFLHYRLMVFWG